jgi:hypothetical protein
MSEPNDKNELQEQVDEFILAFEKRLRIEIIKPKERGYIFRQFEEYLSDKF